MILLNYLKAFNQFHLIKLEEDLQILLNINNALFVYHKYDLIQDFLNVKVHIL